MIHIDAHCDTAGPYEGAKFQHGGPFRLAVLDGVLDPERTIQIGIRGGAEYLWEFSYESGMTVIHAEEVPGIGIEGPDREGALPSLGMARPISPSTSTASIPASHLGRALPRWVASHRARCWNSCEA